MKDVLDEEMVQLVNKLTPEQRKLLLEVMRNIVGGQNDGNRRTE